MCNFVAESQVKVNLTEDQLISSKKLYVKTTEDMLQEKRQLEYEFHRKEKECFELKQQIDQLLKQDDQQLQKLKRENFELFNKITEIYNKWRVKCKIFDVQTRSENFDIDLSDPLKILMKLDEMVQISTTENAQKQLRRIMVNTNQLVRKLFPDMQLQNFNSDQLFDKIQQYITEQDNKLKDLQFNYQVLKQNGAPKPTNKSKSSTVSEIRIEENI